MDSPALFVRRTLWGGLAPALVACAALAAAGRPRWAAGVGMGAAVALANLWLLARAVLRLAGPGAPAAPEGGGAREVARSPRRARRMGVAVQGAVLRFALAGAAFVLAMLFLPVHPLGLAAGLVGAHLGMAAVWMALSIAGARAHAAPPPA